jgi:hypothetical protein
MHDHKPRLFTFLFALQIAVYMYFDVENKTPAERPPPSNQTHHLPPVPSFVSRQSFLRFDYITNCIIANRPFYCFAIARTIAHLGCGTLKPIDEVGAHPSLPAPRFLLICMAHSNILCYSIIIAFAGTAKQTQLFPLSSDADNERVALFFAFLSLTRFAFSFSLFLRS